jgi:LacI family transcriptional regulator
MTPPQHPAPTKAQYSAPIDGAKSSDRRGVRGIAKMTGMSVATVSRVINGAANVAPATRQIVLDAIARAGFEPNPAARALSTRRSRVIGALVPTLSHSIFSTFLNGIERELALYGYTLVVATTDYQPAKELARARDLLGMGAEALIVSGAVRDAALEELIAGRDLPVVATSIYAPRGRLPTIGYDNRALGQAALRYLHQLGHHQIAVLHGPTADNDRTRLRLAGVRAAASGAAALNLIETSLDAEGGAAAARAVLAARPRCTALLCLSDVLALGALFEARRAGVSVPAALSIMGFDDLDWAAVCDPPLTTFRLPTAAMGERAARAVVERLELGIEITSHRLDADIVVRASTAPPRSSDQSSNQAAARDGLRERPSVAKSGARTTVKTLSDLNGEL